MPTPPSTRTNGHRPFTSYLRQGLAGRRARRRGRPRRAAHPPRRRRAGGAGSRPRAAARSGCCSQAAAIQPRSHSSISSARTPGRAATGWAGPRPATPRRAKAAVGGGARVRPEQPPAVDGRAAGGRRRRPRTPVERVRGSELDRADDRERQQRGAPGRGARVGQRVDLVRGEQVQQRRRGHQRRPVEVGGAQLGEVALLGARGDRAPSAAVRGRPAAARAAARGRGRAGSSAAGRRAAGEPAAQRAGAAAEVADDERPLAARAGRRRARRARANARRRRRGSRSASQSGVQTGDPGVLRRASHPAASSTVGQASSRSPPTRAACRGASRGRVTEPVAQRRIPEPAAQRGAERRGACGRDDDPRHPPVRGVPRVSGRPPASLASTGMPRASASVTTIP